MGLLDHQPLRSPRPTADRPGRRSPPHRLGLRPACRCRPRRPRTPPNPRRPFPCPTRSPAPWSFRNAWVWVGKAPPSDADNQDLWRAIGQFKTADVAAGLAALEGFISDHPDSPWTPSLHANFGQHYRERGRFSLALEHWRSAWDLTQTFPDGPGKTVADFTLAHYARLLALLGHTDQVEFLAAQAGERQLDGGPLDQLFSSARERAASVRAHPRDFVACGAAALEEVGRVLQPKFPEVKNPVPSVSPAGYSLTELKSLAKAYNLDMVPVRWPRGEVLPVPCVIHWPGDHFGAVLSRREGWYQIADATFEAPRWIEAQTLQAETTGYVLVPATNAPAPWPILPPAVTDTVFGKDLSYCYLPDSNDELLGKGRCPAHMMSWQVTEPFLNVWLSDSPLGYQPALGPRVAVEIYYKQRNQNSRNPRMFDIGGTGATNSNWTLNWQTYLEVIDQGGTYASFNATLHVGDGGLRTYYVSPTLPTWAA